MGDVTTITTTTSHWHAHFSGVFGEALLFFFFSFLFLRLFFPFLLSLSSSLSFVSFFLHFLLLSLGVTAAHLSFSCFLEVKEVDCTRTTHIDKSTGTAWSETDIVLLLISHGIWSG